MPSFTRIFPLGRAVDPFSLYLSLPRGGVRVLLESARVGGSTGRFSFVACEPFDTFSYSRFSRPQNDPWAVLKRMLERYRTNDKTSYPFVGGAIGFLSYECKDLIEPSLTSHSPDKLSLPLMHFSFFDHALVVDHENDKTDLVVTSPGRGYDRGQCLSELYRKVYRTSQNRIAEKKNEVYSQSPRTIEASMSPDIFKRAVLTIKEHIQKGDIFQANVAQRFRFPVHENTETLYRRLRRLNPSPFFGLYDAGPFAILSGSPERLLKLEDGVMETRPIAGTRARGKSAAEDKRLSQELILNPKERAEHVMLVDLERNDMGRVAEYGSVRVDEFMVLENYSHVKHIVSNVKAVLREGLDAVDALRAVFPGGTITGAPKVRCMEIIRELEPVPRGPYTGSLGYFSFSGNMDMNILIRSLSIQKGWASLHVGAGIVADSDPDREYAETLYKAEAVLCAVFGEKETRRFLRRCGVKR